MSLTLFFFFFSSRRRHTRSLRDWSSDVCSSDLEADLPDARRSLAELEHPAGLHRLERRDPQPDTGRPEPLPAGETVVLDLERSEERRVGKECRSRWSRDHYKQKVHESLARSIVH